MVKKNSNSKPRNKNVSDKKQNPKASTDRQYEITKEDMEALGPKDLSMDMGDDESLKQRHDKVDFAGRELDVPGSELDDEQEDIGSEDEENNHYSLGGDRD
ncbi:hypothetical protein [Negadavirga shengliensis]|uniref:Uncharacterized protein n=1 Tax=Negadavirga shengliensis TaxID=1389218 RepID=A0ABV9SWY6_9BACT